MYTMSLPTPMYVNNLLYLPCVTSKELRKSNNLGKYGNLNNMGTIEATFQSIRLNYYLLYDYCPTTAQTITVCRTSLPPSKAVQCDDQFE